MSVSIDKGARGAGGGPSTIAGGISWRATGVCAGRLCFAATGDRTPVCAAAECAQVTAAIMAPSNAHPYLAGRKRSLPSGAGMRKIA